MNYLDALILGIIQGITEWLPVSSSGHLVIGEQILKLESTVFFDTLLHTATLAAVIVIYWNDISRITKAVLRWDTKNTEFKLGMYVILATIPIVIAGLAFKDAIEQAFSSTMIVAWSLIATGAVLYSTKYAKRTARLNTSNSTAIGIAQVFALLPGISRSGITISTGLHLGLKRDEAARFSFLMFVPAVAGATILQVMSADWNTFQAGPSLLGMAVSFTVSLIALRWLIGVIKKGKLYYFSWYCWAVGLILLYL